jgi:N-acyl-D-aspartate/D-glutamate deacylase
MPRTIDVAAQIPHHPLRVYVMGDRAIRREPATAADIAEMRRLTEEAVRAGAFGFTTSRTNAHKTTQGEMVPGRFAEIDELTGIGAGLGAARAETFGMNSDFEDEPAEFVWLTRLAKETGRPVWFLLTDRPTDPQRWRRIMAGVHRARAAGASMTAQVAGRPVGVILGIATSLNPFAVREQYKPFDSLPLAARLLRLRDPAVRRAILDDRPSPALLSRFGPLVQFAAGQWDRMYVMGDPPDYEPCAETSVAAIAEREGRSPDEVAYDYLTADAGNFLFFPVTGYARDDHEPIREMLTDPGTLLGLGDGGAHVAMIVDASAPTYMLTHYRRFLRVPRPRAARARQARRHQPDRLRPAAPPHPRGRQRPSRRRQATGAARRGLRRHPRRRHPGLRARRPHRRQARRARPPRAVAAPPERRVGRIADIKVPSLSLPGTSGIVASRYCL